MMKTVTLMAFVLICSTIGISQTKADYSILEVGKPMPKINFELASNPTITTDGINSGGWTIFYFWNQGCASCIASLSKINKFQEEFSDKLKVLLVAYNGSQYSGTPDNASIRALYAEKEREKRLTLPISFDSISFHKLKIYSGPCIVIIDPAGIVRHITYTLEEEDIKTILSGKPFVMPKAYRLGENTIQYNHRLPLFLNINGGYDSVYLARTIFSKWEDYMPIDLTFRGKGKIFQIMGIDIKAMYRFAYFGLPYFAYGQPEYTKSFPTPLLHLKDTSMFCPDYRLRKNLFCFSTSISTGNLSMEQIQKRLQNELTSLFNLKAEVKKKKMPYLKLINVKSTNIGIDSTDKSLLKYKSISEFLYDFYMVNIDKQLLVISGVKIDKVNLYVPVNMEDFNSVQRVLEKQGFKFIISTKEMSVIEIYDL
jgi:thiol-disulfide isomerase/thioredoxin